LVITINEQGFEYEAGEKLISCSQCGNTRFFKGKAQLNTKQMTILGLDGFDKSAKTICCTKYFVKCNHCENTYFIKGSAMLNTAGMTLLGLDWANRTAITLMCENCGLIHWFGKPPIQVTT